MLAGLIYIFSCFVEGSQVVEAQNSKYLANRSLPLNLKFETKKRVSGDMFKI